MDVLKRNNVKVMGKGQPLVFAHGYATDQNMWKHITPAFLDTHQIILFDHVGAGLSEPEAFNKIKYNSLSGYADDLLEICETLKLKNPIFIGHSVSSMIGVLAAVAAPNYFQKIVLIGPSACYINRDGYQGDFSQEDVIGLLESIDNNFVNWSTTMAPALMGNPERPALGEELALTLSKTNSEVAKHFAKVTFLSDNRNVLNKVKTPTLNLQCTDDLVAPQSAGKYIKDFIPNSQLVYMKATGHFPTLSAPEETIAAIKKFI